MDCRPKYKSEKIKLPEENLCDFGLGKEFLVTISKTWPLKEKIDVTLY